MEKSRTTNIPLILAIVLLLLPVLYVGSYFALVTPYRGAVVNSEPGSACGVGQSPGFSIRCDYRFNQLSQFYRPIERIDRLLRPTLWIDPIEVELQHLDAEFRRMAVQSPE